MITVACAIGAIFAVGVLGCANNSASVRLTGKPPCGNEASITDVDPTCVLPTVPTGGGLGGMTVVLGDGWSSYGLAWAPRNAFASSALSNTLSSLRSQSWNRACNCLR